MTQKLVLRFDIDTHRCIKHGVPALLSLAREAQVRFTFFCNMGRAVSRYQALQKLLRLRPRRGFAATAPKLPLSAKQGYYHLWLTVLANPRVGMSHPSILRQAHAEGHDVGLHGGRNHGTWQHGFNNWSDDTIRREVAAGKAMFERVLGFSPNIFSSPGWQSTDKLNSILKYLGFSASANRHGLSENEIICEDAFCTLPTNLVAEPGGVAYFESFAARGCSQDEIVRSFHKTLSDGRSLYVLYDHPCFAGIEGLNTVRQAVRCALANNVEITTYSAILQRTATSE